MMFQMGNVAHTIDPRQTAVFQLSGGTTGLPKVAPRLHEEYNYNALPGRRRSAGDREPLPIMHNAGISLALVAR